uniref:Calcium-transporting ATPase n=1 Tax=Rhabditophanes sp. KR3021 TaxID=114890 RepID=A0AC35U3Z9_9BILA
MFGGSTIMEGSGKMLVLCVGMHSQNGLITKLLKNKLEPSKVVKNNDSVTSNEEVTNSDQTILQRKLSGLTNMIGYFGLVSGFVLVFALIGKYILVNFIFADNDLDGNIFSVITNIVILGITVVVVAIPEGLPLAVTISLAYSVMQMTKDNNLVRHLAACETMGNATAICSDKTGTITENKMKAMQCCFNQQFTTALPTYESMYKVTRDLIVEGISVNSAYTSQIKKEKDGVDVQLGNKTECALLGFVVDIGKSYQEIRNAFPEDQLVKVYTFNSTRKAMMTVINLPNGLGYRVYAKGASEIILTRCSYYLVKDDEVQCLRGEEMKYLSNEVIPSMTDDGLRTIGLAYKDYLYKDAKESEYLIDGEIDWEDEVAIREGMTFIGVIGIQDPIRRGVAEAISKCQNAGITVRMVTGDNVGTARTIAVQCGIMKKDDDYLVIESKEFNRRIKDSEGNICQEKLDQLWPRLRVLARAEPTDKYVLVRGMIESKSGGTREVVAVTGDGTNDAPALKKADIGFAMGIAGTDVAKEASDIIITDDNFASLVKAVIWGRNVYDSISKFVQFQLTVNVVAITITIFGSIILPESPLKAVQMLWVNLIMDTFAALALATEKPVSSLLNRKPYGRNAPLVTPLMLKNIVGQAIYQISVLLIALYYDEFLFNYQLIPSVHSSVQHMTCIFNTFVMMTIFNEINSRKIHGERNVFKGIFSNVLFPVIIVGTFGAQFLIVTFGGKWFMVKDLTLRQWGVCVGFGVGSLVWQQILISIPTIKSDPNIKRVVVGKSTVPEHEPMIQMATVDTEAQVVMTEEETMMSPLMRLRLHAFEVRNQLRVIRAFRSDVLNNQSSSGRSIGERIEVLERARCNSENSL